MTSSKYLFSPRLPRMFNLDLKLLLFEQGFRFIPQRRLHLIRHLGHQLGLLIRYSHGHLRFLFLPLNLFHERAVMAAAKKSILVLDFLVCLLYSLWSASIIIGICSTTIRITTPPHLCVAPGLEPAVFPPQPGVLWLQLWATVDCPCWRREFARVSSGNKGN